jgi:hypothetical protein
MAGDKKSNGAGNKEGNGAMTMATKRAMATDGDNMGNCYSKEGGGRLTVVTMETVQTTRPLALQLERGR